ncbi:MAG: PAS domain-containing protein [bacterium]|nr:PAS domain-containing protein [bacterium]
MKRQFKKTLRTHISVTFLVLSLLIFAVVIFNLNWVAKPLLLTENIRMIEHFGNSLVADLGREISMTESLTASLANLGEGLDHDVKIYKKVIPKMVNREGFETIIAGGGIWPEPGAFTPGIDRRSFFWGREPDGTLKYYDDYNDPNSKGYHNEEWYVPSMHTGEGVCFWSKSYMDPYSYQPMVTCTVPMRDGNRLLGVSTIDLKLEGLNDFLKKAIRDTGGYAFVLDRNNKFISFPNESMVKQYATDSKGKKTEEFIYASQLAEKYPLFEPVAISLSEMNKEIIRLAERKKSFNSQLPELIDNRSYQINQEEAQLIAAVMSDPLKEKTVNSTKLKTFNLRDDLVLNEASIVSIFHMPATYWKVVVVTPYSKSAAVVEYIAGKVSLSLTLILAIPLIFTFLLIRRKLLEPLKNITNQLQEIEESASDLSLTIDFTANDELGELVYWLNHRTGELKGTKDYMDNIIDSMPSLLISIDKNGKVTSMNTLAEKATGITKTEAYDRHFTDVFPQFSNEKEKVDKALKDGKPMTDSRVKGTLNGKSGYFDITVYPLTEELEGAVIRLDEVTDQVYMEEMMIQSEKMLSVGGLAAGMAHEINNPLAGILQNVQVMRNRFKVTLPKNEKAAGECGTTIEAINAYMEKREIFAMIKAITESGNRARQIVDNMLSFSRKSQSIFMPHDLVTLLDQTIELASHDYDLKRKYDFRKIKIIRNYHKSMPEVECEASKIQQVLLNLLKNAAQAMAWDDKMKEPPCFTLFIGPDENTGMARIEIKDNGPGMDENTRKRIFEPFFTTKEIGVGTGLGLSVSYFIITQNHRGTMTVESTPGKGTKFIIRLPIKIKKNNNAKNKKK